MGREDQGITNNLDRWQTIPRTLCFVTYGSGAERQVLLLRGAATKRVWPNRLNGVGGHIERNEDFLRATLREVHEETGLTVAQPRLCGIVHIDSGADVGIVMAVWTAEANSQNFVPSIEGNLEWHSAEQLPTSDLVDDLAILLPKVLGMHPQEPPFFAHYSYDEHNHLQIAWQA